jgi:hypothetical protein
MESPGWEEALGEFADTGQSLECQFVKICHHGSATGYIDGLYEKFAEHAPPIAVLTPFNRHRFPLPRQEGIKHLLPKTSELWTTSIRPALRALGIEDPLSVDEVLRLAPTIQRWKSLIDANPELWAVLDAKAIANWHGPEKAVAESAVPDEWLKDLIAEPRLAVLLRPELRSGHLSEMPHFEPIENEHRLSFSFDGLGNEIKGMRHIGAGCGQLTAEHVI